MLCVYYCCCFVLFVEAVQCDKAMITSESKDEKQFQKELLQVKQGLDARTVCLSTLSYCNVCVCLLMFTLLCSCILSVCSSWGI